MDQDPPPERDFDEAAAYPLMEQAVLDTIAGLPDFPGFKTRTYYSPEDCEEALGEQYKGWVSLEIAYTFDGPDSESELVRTTYTDLLREQWTAAGYDLHQDSIDSATGRGSLEAKRQDGINLWWAVSGSVSLAVQTGCIPATEGFDKPDYLPPAGGVLPENDQAAQNRMNPPEDSTGEVIDPFASGSASPSVD
ncbi:hypothetical protein GCM10009830_24600 [Glycomyces endophyticus]|uniref:Uncharacterized protein n=2 Tax=Glycomyces endophyticus TaxID=480996 RepID=A0ABP4SSP2_9ACTN